MRLNDFNRLKCVDCEVSSFTSVSNDEDFQINSNQISEEKLAQARKNSRRSRNAFLFQLKSHRKLFQPTSLRTFSTSTNTFAFLEHTKSRRRACTVNVRKGNAEQRTRQRRNDLTPPFNRYLLEDLTRRRSQVEKWSAGAEAKIFVGNTWKSNQGFRNSRTVPPKNTSSFSMKYFLSLFLFVFDSFRFIRLSE